ncbi:hypothetical protein F0310_05490 (plasmid) [Borrelia sp. A-FGy1]|nr:hypothetical protein F0310_05490 [Borrelia sp. A-FGy1]
MNTNHKELQDSISKLSKELQDSRVEFSKELQDSRSEFSKYIKSLIYPFYWILGIFIPSIIGMFLYLLQK